VAFLVSWALLVAVTWVVAEIAWMIAARLDFGLPLAGPRVPFVARQVAIGAVVSWLLLRYFWERHASQEKMQAETEARYRALQARIRPHFLFNALNSVAELIRSRPDTAERMVEDLSDLFRATLEERTRSVSLAEELEVVKGYLRIEEVRLGDKLMVNWDVPNSCCRRACRG
jgi:Putative regulator of cell autolysis